MLTHFSLDYFDPPPELSRYILTTFCFANPLKDIRDMNPGGVGQLVIFAQCDGKAYFGDRIEYTPPGMYLYFGFSRAAPIHVKGPWHAIGASLSPLGWAALTGEPANKHIDRIPPAREFLGQAIDDFGDDAMARYNSGQVSGADLAQELADWISGHLRSVPAVHEKVMELTIGWLGSSLNPDLNELFASLPYSRRQSERLVERFFGLSPAALARKFRALRAAALLAQDDFSDEAEAEIAEAFVDQPHMIREIRRFCGYTPSRLGGPGDPLFHTMIRLKNLDRLKAFRAIE